MSCKIPLNNISDKDKRFIEESLSIDHEKISTQLFELDDIKENVFIPFNFAHRNFVLDRPTEPFPFGPSASVISSFNGQLRPKQVVARDECLKLLEKERCVILAAQPGFGKTITSIDIMCRMNQKTVIFVKQLLITNQWIAALETYAPSKVVQHVKSGKKINKNADVYILNPLLLKPHQTLEKKLKALQRHEFEHVKLLIVDELHQVVSNVLLRAFFKVQPDYLIGLSATPRRPSNDPFKKAIDWFFGSNTVGDQLLHKHEVYMIKTSFTPDEIKYNGSSVDWNHILTTQSEDEDRNNTIVDIVISRPDRVWLILVKRVLHAEKLKTLLERKNKICETLTGSKTSFDKQCKILIGTTSKIGVGFDHSPINALFVAADVVEYFEQFLGRCMRVPNQVPVVYDMEDSFSILKRHAKIRLNTYLKHGGEIKS